MSDVSIHSNSNNALQDIQTLLNRMGEAPEIEPAGGQTAPKKPLTLGGSAPTVPKAPVPAQPEIEPAGPNANPEGGLLNVPKAVDTFVNGLPKPVLGGQRPSPKTPGNSGMPATRMADAMFSLLDVILLLQKSAQERRNTGLAMQISSRNLKMKNLTHEASAIKAAGETSAKYAYAAAGLQAGTTLTSIGMMGKGAYEQYKAYSQSGMDVAKANMSAVTKDQDLVMGSAKPEGQIELNEMNDSGRVAVLKNMPGTKDLLGENGVPREMAHGEYSAAKLQVSKAQQKVDDALKDVGEKKDALDAAMKGNDKNAIKTAQDNLAKAREGLGVARDYLKEMKANCAQKATAYTEECAAFKKAMDADIKAAETKLKSGSLSREDVNKMKEFRETECQQMLSSKDLQAAFNERIDSCHEQLNGASDRFSNGAAATFAKEWESFSQLAKASGDVAAGPLNAKGGAKDAEEKQKAKLAAAEAERNQNDCDDAAAKAKQALDQLNQANELLKFLAETSRATTNRILGA